MSNSLRRSKSSAQRIRAASSTTKKPSARWLWLGIAAVVVVVGVVSVVIGRGVSGSSGGGTASPSGGTVVPNGTMDYGTVAVTGSSLAALPQTGTDPAVGQEIPRISGTQFNGQQLDIVPTDGKAKIIMVVAHWCPHCQAEVPRVQSWLDEAGMPANIELVTVATSNSPSKPNFPATDWLRREKWSVPTIVDDKENQAGQALGVSGFPYFVVVDAQGRVVYRTSGEIDRSTWDQLLASAQSGTWTTPGVDQQRP